MMPFIDHIQDYDKKILNKTGKHMQILQSDGGNGGEFFNNEMNEYCRMHGIHQRSSTAYTPEQNARAERANRTTLNGINCLLNDTKHVGICCINVHLLKEPFTACSAQEVYPIPRMVRY
jgi:hypothetical protein